jgi:aspartate racemase
LKCIGIVGGLSPEATILYYQIIIKKYYEKFGDHNYPKIIINSRSLDDYVNWGSHGDLKAIEDDLVTAVDALASAGADFAIISANTPHQVYEQVAKRVDIPMLSIVDTVCAHAQRLQIKKIGLLGTDITMTQRFYPDVLSKAGLETVVPNPADQTVIHDIIMNELTRGIIYPESKNKYLDIIDKLIESGAEGLILGCTEIPLLIKPEDVDIPVLDSTLLHAVAALNYALEE